MGIAPSKAQGIKDIGTVASYRHLVELGLPRSERAFKLTDRVLHRLLSRDEDPALLFEYKKAAKTNPDLGIWSRTQMREGATTALAHAGRIDDPRVRGAAHKITNAVSQFLRRELAEKPVIRRAGKNLLHPEAYPPTLFSVAMVAYMPSLQRERAGFVERLGAYITRKASARTYVIRVGRKSIKPTTVILGEPLHASASGVPKDLAFALHWIELLVRLGMLHRSSVAQRVLWRLLRGCDREGIWTPTALRTMPKSASKLADFAFPLELDGKTAERRRADVTFRLALIAKLARWELEYI